MSKKNKSNVAMVDVPEMNPNNDPDSESGEFKVPLVDVPEDDTLTRDEIVAMASTPTVKAPLDKSALKLLMSEYEKRDDVRTKALKQIEECAKEQSVIVGKIAAMTGSVKKIVYKGETVTLVGRKNKKTGETTWFFKGKSTDEDVLDLG